MLSAISDLSMLHYETNDHANAYVEMTRRVHRISPLRRDDSNRAQMRLDLTGCHIGSEDRLVDQKWPVLDRSIRRKTVSWDLVSENS
jgi:hypothetical protein